MSSFAGWTPTCNQWETLLAWLLRPCSLKANCTRFFVWILRCYDVMFWFDLVMQNKKKQRQFECWFKDVSWEIPNQWDMITHKHTQNLKRMIVFNMPINRADPQLLRLVCDGLQAQGPLNSSLVTWGTSHLLTIIHWFYLTCIPFWLGPRNCWPSQQYWSCFMRPKERNGSFGAIEPSLSIFIPVGSFKWLWQWNAAHL